MWFGILGPVSVRDDCGGGVVMPSGIPGTVLSVLLLEPNRVVSRERLAQAVWGGDAPAEVAAGLRNHVLRLRRQLGPVAGARVRTAAGGYLVEVGTGELDAVAFEEGCRRGRLALQAGDAAEASRLLSNAMELWRGEPLPGLSWDADAEAQVQRLHEVRLLALEGRTEADLLLGRHGELVAELQSLAGAHPLRESVHGQLMLALYRSGRQAEALDAFQALRRTLVEELGLEPSAEVRELHQRILTADPSLTPSADRKPASGTGVTSQLPSDTRSFTGRERELEDLLALARRVAGGQGGGALEVCAIDGMGGIGKSALAVHAAHRLRAEFPDGQLFIDLHSHTPGIDPLTAADALDWLLRSLGTPPTLIPDDGDERAALYRDRLADTRTLIVLDNASSTAQVRPLLPAAPGCLVLVTSRRRLTGLDDAHNLALDVLPHPDAVELLHAVAGPDRIPAAHPAIDTLIELCGHMPLAIRITAARLRHHRALTLDDAVERLRDEHARLAYLEDEDRNLTAIFESSYTALPAAEQRLFRLLGLIPGPDLDAYAAAAQTDSGHREAERRLESLLDHNLLTMHTPGRYRLHDLLRLYARDLGTRTPDRQAARTRLLDYYQHAAQAADRHITRYHRPGTPSAGPPSSPVLPQLPDYLTALAWMRSERDNLIAAVADATAASGGTDSTEQNRVITLTGALDAYLRQDGPWTLGTSLHRTAIATARKSGDRLAEANALHDLGRGRSMTGSQKSAAEHLNEALELYRELGNRLGEANTLHDLARVRHMTGDFTAATGLHDRTLLLYRELGDHLGEANALHDLGRTRMMTGDVLATAEMMERALELYDALAHPQGQANALWTLGWMYARTGDYPRSADVLERALRLTQATDSRLGQANARVELARLAYLTGDYATAEELQRQNLTDYQNLGHGTNAAYAQWDLGRIRQATGDPASAADLHQQAIASFRHFGVRQGEANGLHTLGQVRQALGDTDAAADLYRQALEIFRQLGDTQGETQTLNSSGTLATRTGDPIAALDLHRQALSLAREIHSPLEEAHALQGTAQCATDHDTALTAMRQAVAIYRRIGSAAAPDAERLLAALEVARPSDRVR